MKIKLTEEQCWDRCKKRTIHLCGFKIKVRGSFSKDPTYGYLCLSCGNLAWDPEDAMAKHTGVIIEPILANFILKCFLGKDENIII